MVVANVTGVPLAANRPLVSRIVTSMFDELRHVAAVGEGWNVIDASARALPRSVSASPAIEASAMSTARTEKRPALRNNRLTGRRLRDVGDEGSKACIRATTFR